MYKKVRVYYYQDTSIENSKINVTATVGGNQYSGTINVKTSISSTYKDANGNGLRFTDITLSDVPSNDITFSIIQKTAYLTKTFTFIRQITKIPEINFATIDENSIYIFNNGNNTITITENNPFGNESNLNEAKKEYNIKTIGATAIYNNISKNLTSNVAIENGELKITISYNSIFDFSNTYGLTPDKYNGTYNFKIHISIVSFFEEDYGPADKTITLNFNKAVTFQDFTLKVSKDKKNWYDFDNSKNKLQKGLYYKFTITYTYWTYEQRQFKIIATQNNNSFSIFDGLIKSDSIDGAINRSGKTESIDIITDALPAIENGAQVQTKIKSGNSISSIKTYKVIQQIEPIVSLLNLQSPIKVGNIYKYKFTALVSTYNCSESLTLTPSTPSSSSPIIAFARGALRGPGGSTDWVSDWVQQEGKSYINSTSQVEYTVNGWDNTAGKKYKTNIYDLISANFYVATYVRQYFGSNLIYESVTYAVSDYKTIQIATATIAYRKNFIGINKIDPDESGVIDINRFENHRNIYINGYNDNQASFQIRIGLEDGKIELLEGTNSIHIIDLLNGTID